MGLVLSTAGGKLARHCADGCLLALPPPLAHPPLAERFKDRLVDEGYNPAYGARPLRRAIMRLLEDSMAERMLAGDIKEGDSVIIDIDADGQISVLNGDKRMTTTIDSMPAGIS